MNIVHECSVELIDYMGNDLTVVNSARVSFNKHSEELSEADVKLIKYLAKHKHISPFGHCFASFRIKTPIFVARQLVKHKFLRINEVSRRYVDADPEFYIPNEWRARPRGGIKQGSGEPVEDFTEYKAAKAYHDLLALAQSTYAWMIEHDIAPEQARMLLPQSTLTEFYWSGSLDAFAAMCKLRCAEDTQFETRLVADQVAEHLEQLFPISFNALMEN